MTDHSADNLPDTYAQAIAACNRREWLKAQTLALQLARLAPEHGGVCYIAGVSSMELKELPKAIPWLRRALELDPKRANFAIQYAKALSLAGAQDEAMHIAKRAESLTITDPTLHFSLGMVFALGKSHRHACEQFRRATELMPTHADSHYQFAIALIALGDLNTAHDELTTCLSLDASYWKAHLSLSLLRKQTANGNHLERLATLLTGIETQSPRDNEAMIYLNMALAKEFEDLSDYDHAFEHLAVGKRAGGRGRSYSSRTDQPVFDALKHLPPVSSTAGTPVQGDKAPIFVIGMPRSGTTLVDRILSSHPDVYSAGELNNFPLAFKHASGSRTPLLLDADTINRSTGIDWQELGLRYLASTLPDTAAKPRFIDKLPHNFLYAGAIAHALPNARIVCLRRDPVDTCLSNFRQLFAQGSPFHDYSYDLLDTGRYYIQFDRLMSHWMDCLPGRIFEIHYENLVENQENCSRRLLDFCDLGWDDACLSFEKNASPVASASAVQVREPIYRNALQRWQKYGTHLDALRQLLGNAGVLGDTEFPWTNG